VREPPRRYAELLRSGEAQLAEHEAFLQVPFSARTFDVDKPLRAAAFAGFQPRLYEEAP
jgi:hypothetical protein